MPDQPSHLKITRSDSVHVVHFADRKILDELCITEIGDELNALVAKNAGIQLLISFRNVEHLSSAALGMLISLHKEIEKVTGRMHLSDIAPPIFEVFKMTRLNKLFAIYGTEKEALAAF